MGWTNVLKSDASQLHSLMPGGPQRAGFRLPMNLPPSHVDFVRLNRVWLAAVAWEGHQEKGRGIVLVNSDVQMVLTDAQFRFLSASEYAATFKRGRVVVSEMAARYDPEVGFVVGFLARDSRAMHFYAVVTTPAPAKAYEAKPRLILDALSRYPRISKDVHGVERCLSKLMPKLGMETSSRELFHLINNIAVAGMNLRSAPPERTPPLGEKTDISTPTRTAPLFYQPYTMDGEPALWDLFNLHLRPLSDPQPAAVIKHEKDGALIAAASILWAFEQNRKLSQRAKPKSVLPDYLHAYEMVRIIAAQARVDRNERAVEALASIARLAADELEKLPKDTVSYVARRHPSWPVLVSAKATDRSKQTAAYLEELNVGVACPLNVGPGARWVEGLAATRHAKKLFANLEYNRDRRRIIEMAAAHTAIPSWVAAATMLPPFSKASAERWWKVALVTLNEACPKLEEHPDFNVPGAVVSANIEDPTRRRGVIISAIRQVFVALASHECTQTWRFDQRDAPPAHRL